MITKEIKIIKIQNCRECVHKFSGLSSYKCNKLYNKKTDKYKTIVLSKLHKDCPLESYHDQI